MNFVGLFRQEHAVEKTDHEEDGVAQDQVLAELSPPPLQHEPDFGSELEDALAEALAVTAEASADAAEAAGEAGETTIEPSPEHRITPHSQTRLAALSAFEDLTQGARQDLQALGLTLAKVTSNHHLMRGFLTGIHADIQRANEMELSNARLTAESRRLSHQLDEAHRQLSAREAANDALEHRIVKLVQETASLRDALSETRLEASDSTNMIAELEAERADLTTALAGKTLSVEKLLRENEVMREKQVSLSMDLEAELKAHGESQRRIEELAAIHSSDAARLAEMAAKAAHGEKEVARLQKQNDTLNATVQELTSTIGGLESEREDRASRHAAEIAGLEGDMRSLGARLQEASKATAQKNEQIDDLTAKLNEASSDRRVALEKLETLRAEHERDKQQLSAAFANFSQLNVLQTSEHVMLDMHRQEAEDLRREISNLETTIKRLAPHEKVYQASKARPGKRPNGQGKRETTNGSAGSTAKGAA